MGRVKGEEGAGRRSSEGREGGKGEGVKGEVRERRVKWVVWEGRMKRGEGNLGRRKGRRDSRGREVLKGRKRRKEGRWRNRK